MTLFELRDEDGWLGVEAEGIQNAKFAAVTLAGEGYELPIDIVRQDGPDVAVYTLIGFDAMGGPIWRSSDAARVYLDETRRAA